MDKLVYDNGGEIKKGDIVEYKDGERCEVIEAGILVNSETGEFFGIMLHIRPTGPTVYQYRSVAPDEIKFMDRQSATIPSVAP